MIASKSFAGGTTNAKFIDFIRDDLCPHFHRGDVVVKDNLRQHKQAEVERLLKRRRCRILYLPPYSPDFNPLELSFSQVKAVLRKRCIRDMNK
ncbi:MAG: transposase [Planctomycetaceae bacterium]|jgi:transposase|nr:transposase [Planctomycetaceae bacterium]